MPGPEVVQPGRGTSGCFTGRVDPDPDGLPPTGTCDLTTVGRRRSGQGRRVEIWYVLVDGRVVVTGTPGARHWLANLRDGPTAGLHLRGPARDVAVAAHEVNDAASRRRVAVEAWRLQPWYAEQPYQRRVLSSRPLWLETRPQRRAGSKSSTGFPDGSSMRI